MIVLVSLIQVVLQRGFPCFHNLLHGASHPYIAIHSDFYTWLWTEDYLRIRICIDYGALDCYACACSIT